MRQSTIILSEAEEQILACWRCGEWFIRKRVKGPRPACNECRANLHPASHGGSRPALRPDDGRHKPNRISDLVDAGTWMPRAHVRVEDEELKPIGVAINQKATPDFAYEDLMPWERRWIDNLGS